MAGNVPGCAATPFLKPRRRDGAASGTPNCATLRVARYNILLDQKASRDADCDDADRAHAHCDTAHLVKWRRHPLIVCELLACAPDVALQELDANVFIDLLRPTLEARGFEGWCVRKGAEEEGNGGGGGGIREGCFCSGIRSVTGWIQRRTRGGGGRRRRRRRHPRGLRLF